eukprot:TRINITY_DN121211_c0_g1_i1.p1 TRINITY_DN121211_c0_g1~~TRINITY_DN121211_c0_g1_i1.p1  ORF type:complete len:398 (-),score=65.78 TRINITY_DN121211_c0_g1_i1:166-1359(-)
MTAVVANMVEAPATVLNGKQREISGKSDGSGLIDSGLSDSGKAETESIFLSTSRNCSRECTAQSFVDSRVHTVVNEFTLSQALKTAVAGCRFCVTVADPRGIDTPLIAVSEEFETMTGFQRLEILGVNCRFLNQGCDVDPMDLMQLRLSSQTGAPFTALLPNRKKSGELFLNLLDLRGLTVAKNTKTGSDLWFLIGIQADVTNLVEESGETEGLSQERLELLQKLADRIRMGIKTEVALMAMNCADAGDREFDDNAAEWQVLNEPLWRSRAAEEAALLNASSTDADMAAMAGSMGWVHSVPATELSTKSAALVDWAAVDALSQSLALGDVHGDAAKRLTEKVRAVSEFVERRDDSKESVHTSSPSPSRKQLSFVATAALAAGSAAILLAATWRQRRK